MKKTDEPVIYDPHDYCHNWILDEPLVTVEKVKAMTGIDITVQELYEDFPHMGGVVDNINDIKMQIRITDQGVMDVFGEEILSKKAVKQLLDVLMEIYSNYDKYYDKYVSDFRESINEQIMEYK